jgi:hypothetical protein
MHNEHDVWNTALYHRAIQKRIGAALSARHDTHTPTSARRTKGGWHRGETNRATPLRPENQHPPRRSSPPGFATVPRVGVPIERMGSVELGSKMTEFRKALLEVSYGWRGIKTSL